MRNLVIAIVLALAVIAGGVSVSMTVADEITKVDRAMWAYTRPGAECQTPGIIITSEFTGCVGKSTCSVFIDGFALQKFNGGRDPCHGIVKPTAVSWQCRDSGASTKEFVMDQDYATISCPPKP